MARIHELAELLKHAPDEVFLQPHNVPDPDAIAACFGLQQLLAGLGVRSEIVYEDEIEKANSVAMLKTFDISMAHSADIDTLGAEDWTVLVDVQKTNANYTDLVTDEVAVIDHHRYNGAQGHKFEDVRPEVGACSSIIAEYFQEAGVTPSRTVASALLYGIFMDTRDLTRGTNGLDIDMFYWLYNQADIGLISRLKSNALSLGDLRDYAKAFKSVEVYGQVGFLPLENGNDSLLGAASDIVTSVAGVNVVVSYAIRDSGVKYSTRSTLQAVSASELVRHIVDGHGIGGGHDTMAGGFVTQEKLPVGKGIDTFTRVRAIEFVERAIAGE